MSRMSVSGGTILDWEALDQSWTSWPPAPPRQNCALATVHQRSMAIQAFAEDLGRIVPTRLHIDSGAVMSYHAQKMIGQSEAQRDPALVAPGGGTQQQAHRGERSPQGRTPRTWERSSSRVKRLDDEARELLVLVRHLSVSDTCVDG